jgi:hypothetical protein
MLDWKKWKNSELSLIEFLLLNLIYQSSNSNIPFNPKEELDNLLFESLVKKEYIREGAEKFYLAVKGAEFFNTGRDNFEVFFNTFPQKVPDNRGGDRLLRAVNLQSKNGSEAYRKWKMATVGNEEKENHLINCLKAEINVRASQGQMPYMNNILTCLTQKKWEFYEHLVDEQQKEKKPHEKSI